MVGAVIVFDMRGHPWSRLESVRAASSGLCSRTACCSRVTSYDALEPRLGLLAGFTVPQHAALGDGGQSQGSSSPPRNSYNDLQNLVTARQGATGRR